MTHFSNAFTDEEGYEELRKHMKLTYEFSKDMVAILQERADLETIYAKGLAKVAARSSKAAKDSVGSLMSAWNVVCIQLGCETEAHRLFGESLHEEICKPLKISVDQQVKNRKMVEVTVDRAIKTFQDKKMQVDKSKKTTHTKAKESEHMSVQLEDPTERGKILSDKELSKLQLKTKRAEQAAMKADMDYLDLIKGCERARHEMERTMVRAVLGFESQEIERITEQKQMLTKYSEGFTHLEPCLQTCVEELSSAMASVNAEGDIILIANSKGKEAKPHEQLLYDAYEEDMGNTIKKERRRSLLDRKIHTLDTEIQKEQRAREGIARLCGVYTETPGFADENAKQDVEQQLLHSNDMLNVLRASRYKIMASKALLDKLEKPEDDIANYITFDKTKQGSRNTTLRIPKNAPPLSPLVECMGGRGTGDGALSGGDMTNSMNERRRSQMMTSMDSFQSDASFDEDDGDNVNNDGAAFYAAIDEAFNVTEEGVNGTQPTGASPVDVDEVIGQCKVIYGYTGQEQEELTIQADDVINLYSKDDDGWWRGELNGVVGIFPGSYVEESIEGSTDL